MNKIFYIIPLLFILASCEDRYESTHRYYRQFIVQKDYPIYLDAGDILVDICVQPSVWPNNPFKIVANDRYYFVGEKMKGIHVYEKIATGHATPICFIECRHLKAFDVAGDMLYCNNFVDLLIIDVKDPLQATVKHRENEYFNKYSGYDLNMAKTYNYPNRYLIGYYSVILTGFESDKNPAPDFAEYDKQYNNIVVKEIPDTLKLDKPYVGIVNVAENIFTFGFNTWVVTCSYTSGVFTTTQSTKEFLRYSSPGNLLYKDEKLYEVGNNRITYLDDHYLFTQNPNLFFWWNNTIDVVAMKEWANSFALLYENDLMVIDIGGGSWGIYSAPPLGATSIINVNDTILALGQQLTIFRSRREYYDTYGHIFTEQVKEYKNISGTSMLKEGNTLIVAGKQGLSFYDISDLERITFFLLPPSNL